MFRDLLLFSALLTCLGPVARAEAIADTSPFAGIDVPNYAGLAFGTAPDYLGSDDYIHGPAPFFRLSRGERYVALDGNYATINLLDHPNFSLGPSGILRVGRNDVADDFVSQLPPIRPTIEMGAFASYVWVDPADSRNRLSVGVDATQDVFGVHGGYVASVTARGFFGIGRYTIGGLGLGASWGSGSYMDKFFSIDSGETLPAFDATAGPRDVRMQLLVVQPLSRKWSIGGGFQYQRLMSDAADSPVTADRGSADQWIVGVGAGRTW